MREQTKDKIISGGLVVIFGTFGAAYFLGAGYNDSARIKAEQNREERSYSLPPKIRSYDKNKDGLIDYKEANELEKELLNLKNQ